MTAIERLIEAYAEESQSDHCPKVTYFGKGREGVIEAARQERDELLMWISTVIKIRELFSDGQESAQGSTIDVGKQLLAKHLGASELVVPLP